MIENVIGSLIAAVICKVVKEVSEGFSQVKEEIQNIKDKQRQKQLQEKIDEAEKQIQKIQSDIIAETTRALAAPLEKVIALNSIRAVFERASAISRRGAKDQDVEDMNYELGGVNVRRAIRYLSQPLSIGQGDRDAADLIRDIDSLTAKMKQDYELHEENLYFEAAQILQWCHKLEDMLIRYMERKVENVSV